MPAHHLLTVDEVAARLHVCTRTVWRWTKAGDMPAPVRLGKSRRVVRWKAVEIDTFLEQILATLPAGHPDMAQQVEEWSPRSARR